MEKALGLNFAPKVRYTTVGGIFSSFSTITFCGKIVLQIPPLGILKKKGAEDF